MATKTAAPTPTTHTNFAKVPLDRIVEQDGINPRGQLDTDDVAELAASIKDRGVLQPIRVRIIETGDTNGNRYSYRLIAGKRRLAAATLAGLTEIPAVVVEGDDDDVDGDALDALIENVQRQDLSPLEEARALAAVRDRLPKKQQSGRQLAQIVKRSDDWVSDRLRLLTLPDQVADAIDDGTVGLHAMPALSRIAESGPGGADLAAALVTTVADGDLERRALEDPEELAEAIDSFVAPDHNGKTELVASAVSVNDYQGYLLSSLPISDEVKEELRDRWNALPVSSTYYDSRDAGQKRRCTFDQDDADAARAYGCLLEIEVPGYAGSTDASQYITDPEFIADRVRLWLERAEKEAAQRGKKPKESKSEREAREAREADEAERAQQEQAEKIKRYAAAFAANDDLGRTTLEALRKVKPDDRVIELICFAALEGLGWNHLAASGLRFVDDQLREVKPEKGAAKYAGEERCGQRLRELFDAASTPAEMLGVTVRAIVLAQHADTTAKGQSWVYALPGSSGTGPAAIFPALVDEVAFRAEALTPAARDAAIAKARVRDEAAEEERRAIEEEIAMADRVVLEALADAGCEKTTPPELVKLVRGGLESSRVAHRPHVTVAAIKAAIARVEERNEIVLGSDGEYYPTKAGLAAHEANLQWWRAEGREQAFRRRLAWQYRVTDSTPPDVAAEIQERMDEALERARAKWAEEDAKADQPPVVIVHVKPTGGEGDPQEAELQPDRQKGRPNVRKVVYTDSRTAAWVAVKRIVDLPEDEAA